MHQDEHTTDPETLTISSASGLRATIIDRGATLARLQVSTPQGDRDVVLRYEDAREYVADPYFIGATVGPFANRIRDARFSLGDDDFALDANEQATGHCLHGGSAGLHRQVFSLRRNDEDCVACHVELPDGLCGFPGNRHVNVVYRATDDNELVIDFAMTSDRDTIASIANHAYFNLGGALDEHDLVLYADAYTPVHAGNVPTGEIRAVAGTRFDLREPGPLGERAFDHNFVVADTGGELRHVARLISPGGGLRLDVLATQPGLQVFTADSVGAPFGSRSGVAIEAQAFPDAPNQPGFPPAVLAAGETWRARTIYRFTAGAS